MTDDTPRKLPAMSVLEYAIENDFRYFTFGLRMALMWAILMLPIGLGVWFGVFHGVPPDVKALKPQEIAVLAALAGLVLLASCSIAVNWHRRIILNQSPKWLGWVTLGGAVWRYLFGFLFVVVIAAMIAAAAAAAALMLPPAIETKIGTMAKPAGVALAALLGIFGLFTWYRLSTLLPAIATGDKDYTLATAWRATRNNKLAFLGFTFWLVFTLAIAGAAGAGAVYAQQMLGNPYATAAAFVLAAVLAWLSLFLITTVATSHYAFFSGRENFPD